MGTLYALTHTVIRVILTEGVLDKTKAVIVVAVSKAIVVAVGRTHIVRFVVPRAAAPNTVFI
jgi:hypothetical protein